ncbi:hypothetical protein HOD50_03350 [Candidatus Bathyarchaeota archaeon]|nr:hypothetical protein [Candidatus Bathyarchaeota archaeon]MBT5642016.1 hypothetical protein [Candidatus Bathyarchaeota archaeon]
MRGSLVQYIREHRDLLTYVLLAELSLIVMSLVVLTAQPTYPTMNFIMRACFALICAFGIITGLFPAVLSFSKAERRDGEGVSGHHPDCGRFNGHTVNLLGQRRCAGCTGLVIGAVASMMGLGLGLLGLNIDTAFWCGVLLVGAGLAQHFIDLGNEWVHLSLNTLFVVGAWIMFESIQALGLGVKVQVYFLSMTVFWIWARIRASQWVHVGVCSRCPQACVHFFE